MKVLARLPEQKHFRAIAGTERWPYIWEDKSSPLLRVCATVPNPWDKQWAINCQIQKGKSDKAVYPTRLDLQCLKFDEALPHAQILRETYHGKFGYSNRPTLHFFSLPTSNDAVANWLMISIVLF